MPFITQEKRDAINNWGHTPVEPGDLCYVFYKDMVKRWKANPRWTTAHKIYKDMHAELHKSIDDACAHELAWQVFFQLYVIPYELKKREENGNI